MVKVDGEKQLAFYLNLEHQRGTNTENTGYSKQMCSESTARCSKAAHSIGRNTTSTKWDSDFPVDGHHLR